MEIVMKSGNSSAACRLKVGFVLARSFTLSAFALFIDTLRLASDEQDKSGRVLADWQVLGSTRHLIASSCGVQVAPTSDFTDPAGYDYIVVVGGLLKCETQIDVETKNFLKKAATAKVPLIGVCTGTFVLAEAGLMEGHEICVSWLHFQEFRERFPDLKVRSDRLFNLDRQRGSCAGGSSAADMAAYIVRHHISKEAERNALEVLQIDKARSHLDIQPRKPMSLDFKDPRLKAALIIMEQHTEDVISVQQLADAVGVSRRQLERLFSSKANTSPGAIYKMVRLERAKTLVTHTKAPLVEIAVEVGFESASHFARVFRRTYGKSPTKLRADLAT
jgi:transcriptional regulator GlxA family with amidase domain